jgi:hypothetical protein
MIKLYGLLLRKVVMLVKTLGGFLERRIWKLIGGNWCGSL